ncbi:MAG TPA: TonB-dependent receptor [Candidatus Dormibacteraeota bacterium]|nr:TonB-dependent receptor [Candidatus Dormibacteraeota bacterium]
MTKNQSARAGRRLAMFILAWSALARYSAAAAVGQRQANLANESLQDLMSIQVTTVSKTEQKLSQTASAVFVITQEDIARSGATNIPDLLRMVPGMDVAQINANTWAINARGFNARFANELQVLVDGRSVYTDSFGGVFWDQLDLPLEDIERIEVIRGPGGSVWGGNAVNGVINIITKKASETRGAMITAGGGTVEQGFGTVQYGGSAGKSTDYRVFAKYFNDGHLPDFSGGDGGDGGDGWHMLRGGFRSDTTLTARDKLTFEGDLYTGREGSPTTDLPSVTSRGPIDVEDIFNLSGGFLQGMWNHQYSPRSDSTLEVSFDQYERNDTLHDHRGTLDINFQHHIDLGGRQSFLWGAEYRLSMSKSDGGLYVSFVPADVNTAVYSGFVEDQIAIVPNRVLFTAGARLEHNYYSGFNLMPSARVAWTMTARQMIWTSVSRAVRTPSAVDANLRANLESVPGVGGVPDLIAFIGNPNLKDEGLTAFEAGYRVEIAKALGLDISSYYNLYDHQETAEPAAPFLESSPTPPHLVIPTTYGNLMHGETDGLEISAEWRPASWWTLSPGYAFEQIHMHLAPGSQDTTSVAGAQGASPAHSAQLRSHVHVWRDFSWDVSSYFVDRLADPAVPSYTRLDTQVSWNFGEGTTLSLVGQNLAQDHHEEFVDSTNTERTTLVKRSAFVKFTARF